MAAIVTTNMNIYAASLFMNSFNSESEYIYLFIGNTLPWNNENSPPTPVDCESNEAAAFIDMMSLKRITGSSVSLIIPNNTWTVGTVYSEYSSLVDLFDPTDALPFYVISSQLNVYKCLNNNGGAYSTIQPTGTSTSVITVADGYQWKFMYTVSSTDVLNFVTNEWVPVKTLAANDGSNQWLVQQAAVSGTIDRIDIVTAGVSYTSVPTVVITGNGSGATATATIGGGNVTGVTVTATGTNYTWATISFTGGGSGANGATANAIISPFKGHGADPVTELGGFYVMIDCKLIGNESGYFTVSNDYRQVGLISNPILNNGLNTTPATALDYSQALSLTFSSVSGTTFNNDETVTGLTSGAIGVVEDWDGTSILRLVQSLGTFTPGETVQGADATGVLSTITGTAQSGSTSAIVLANSASSVNSTYNGQTINITSGTGVGQVRMIASYIGLSRTAGVTPVFSTAPDNTSHYVVANIVAPAIVAYEGQILYLENRRAIARSAEQTEDIKIIITF
jgi:hypothetical protein